jgi:hypothetical protein
MKGADYIALTKLTRRATAEEIAAGKDDRGWITRAEIGEACERVPDRDLPWLLEQECIAPKPTTILAGEAQPEVVKVTPRKRKTEEA